MKKMKFLSGINAIFALAAVALATTFTSCEKEDFNVNTEPVEPVNATATVNAKVILIEDGVSRVLGDNEVDVKYEPARTFTGNPNLAAQTVTITATYKEVKPVTMQVDIPALQAGQSVVITPTIVLARNSAIELEMRKDENVTVSDEVKTGVADNYSIYYYDQEFKWTEKTGTKYVDTTIEPVEDITAEELKWIASLEELIKSGVTYAETEKSEMIYVGAMSRTEVTVTYKIDRINYEFYRKTVAAETRAIGDEIKLATVVTDTYSTLVDKSKVDQQIPGHDHAPMGHGHGLSHDHGHGSGGNAGGGIIIAD